MTYTRRQFIVTVGAVGAVALVAPVLTPAQALAEANKLDAAIKSATGGATPKDGAGIIELDLPEIAENGNTVPVGFSVTSPMTDSDHVAAVWLFASGNPSPEIANFRFTPMSGEASTSIRMRLAKTQNIVAVAKMSDGSVYRSDAEVKVTIGGCGG